MFCLVGLAPQEGLELQTRGGDMKLEVENDHSVSSNEEQHKCSYKNCEKVFSDKGQLYEHRQTHSELTVKECQFCKSFFSATTITAHRRSCQRRSGKKTIIVKNPMSKPKNNVPGKSQNSGSAPDWVSVEHPGAFCEISILDHDYYSIETKTGIQLKTSVSFEFFSLELRTVIYLIFSGQRDVPNLPGPEPTA